MDISFDELIKKGNELIKETNRLINTANKYKRGKIYKISDNGYNEIYIGSTTEKSINTRLIKHKALYKWFLDNKYGKVTVYDIFNKYGVDNCKIELIENYPCRTRDELHKREGYHIQNNNCVNKVVAGRTASEYRKANKDRRKIETAKYRKTHKQQIKERSKLSREKCREKRLASKKAYYQKNKDKILQQQKLYRQQAKLLTNDD